MAAYYKGTTIATLKDINAVKAGFHLSEIFRKFVSDWNSFFLSGHTSIHTYIYTYTEYYCVWKTVDEVMSQLQIGIREISEWCKSNNLTIHPAKSEIMIVSNKKFIGPLSPVKLGDNIVVIGIAATLYIYIELQPTEAS